MLSAQDKSKTRPQLWAASLKAVEPSLRRSAVGWLIAERGSGTWGISRVR
jgi:hypothetical protein